MLPVPFDHPLVAPLQYNTNQPPVVPNISVHPEGHALLIPATSLCANALGAASGTSAIRMFCFNILSVNGWANQDFFDMVRIVVDYVSYKKLTNTVGNVYVALEEVANNVASLYSARTAYACQEFYMGLDLVSQQRVQQNVAILNDWIAKADSVYSSWPQHQPQQMQRPVTHMSGALNMGTNPGPRGGHVGLHQAQQMSHMHPGRHVATSGHPAAAAVTTSHHQNRTVDNFIQNKFCAGVRTARNTAHEGEDMNRNIHQIAYRGSTVVTAPARPVKKPESQVQAIQKGTISMVLHVPPESLDALPYFAGDICEVNLATALQTVASAVTHAAKALTAEYLVFKTFLTEPVPSAVKIPDGLMKELKTCVTFAKVSEVLRKYQPTPGLVPEDAYFLKLFMDNLDKTITAKANEYFTRQMPDGGFSISSVLDDGADVQLHVSSQYKTRANPSFVSYQKSFLSNLFTMATKEEAELPEELNLELSPVDYVLLVTQMMITSISTTAADYEYLIGENLMLGGPVLVTQESNASFFDILAILNKAGKNVGSSKNMLVTMDGVKWVFWECATDSRTFTIQQE